MSDNLTKKLNKNLEIIKEHYPDFLGIDDKRQIDVDKYNGKYNLSVGYDSLSPPVSLSVMVECSDSVIKTLKVTSKFVSKIFNGRIVESEQTDREKITAMYNDLIIKHTDLKEKLDSISNRHLRETQTILTERDNEKQDNIRLLKENKALTDKIERFSEQQEELWDKYLKYEKAITIMQDNCKHNQDCIRKPKKEQTDVIDARQMKLGEENY